MTKKPPEPAQTEPAKRPRGRPPGTGQGRRKQSYNLSLDADVVAWLKSKERPGAAANKILRAAMEREIKALSRQ